MAMRRQSRRGTNRTGWGESALTMGSAMMAEPLAGLAGILALPAGLEKSSKAIDKTREALTYLPRTQAGIESLEDVGYALGPVGSAFENLSSTLGKKTQDVTGSETLAALAHTLPDILLSAPGLAVTRSARNLRNYPEVTSAGPGGRQKGMLAGPAANTADLEALEQAKKMKAAGASPRDTIEQTGWFEQYPGQWTYEIPDTGYKLKDPTATTLGGAVEHPAAFEAYPQLRDVPFSLSENRAQEGRYLRRKDTEHGLGDVEVGKYLSPEDMESTALHEAFGHGVQDIEGRVGGTNVTRAKRMQDLGDAYFEYQMTQLKKDPNYNQIRSKVATDMLGDRQVNMLPVQERAAIRKEATRAADDALGVSDLKRQRANMTANSPAFHYAHDMGEAEARMIQGRLNAIREMRGQGMTDAEIDTALKSKRFEYDVIPEHVKDVEGDIKFYEQELKSLMGM